MKDIIKYISAIATLCVFFSCSFKEDFASNKTHSVEYIARITGFNNVDVATKSAPTEEFETAVYTAYFLLFDSNTGDRIAIESVDVTGSSLSQTIVGKMPGSVTACFIANVSEDDVNDLTTLDALNSAVLNITYATYTEAGGYLGVPKLTVNGESKLCIPMFGSVPVNNLTNGGNIEIPVKRLFAKVSMNIKMQLTNVGIGQIVPSTVNYELSQYQLYNLPTKVHLVGNVNDDETYESDWVGNKSAFYANATTPLSSNSGLGLQTINISDSDTSTDNNSDVVAGIEFCLYVPEYYLLPKSNGITNDQKYKPQNYDKQNKNAIYVELVGEVNQSLIDNTTIHHNIFLGEDNTDNYTLKRNLNYINQITIKGIDNNDKGTGDNLDHRVTTEVVNNPVAQAGKAANCYIIATPGKYTIPAYKGAYNNLNGAALCMEGKNLSEYDTKVEVLANVVEYESITSITFSESPTYDSQTNTISFTVDKMLTDNWVPNGSVIMALKYKKKGESTWATEWSWHLWFVFKVGKSEDGWGAIGYQDMPGGNDKMMDRNLGVNAAISAGTKAGFYYKYGEHTPYLDPDGDGVYTQFGGGSVSNSTPTWNVSGKSVTDPCPPGYKVPLSTTWTNQGSHSSLPDAYRYASLSATNTIYYPYSGYINQDYTTASDPVVSIDKDADEYTYSVPNITEYAQVKVTYRGYSFNLTFPVSKTVSNVTFLVSTTASFGEFWASNGLISYGHAAASLLSGNTRVKQYKLTTTKVKSVTAKGLKWEGWSPTLDYEINEYEESYQYNTGLSDEVLGLMLTDYLVRGGTVSSSGLITSDSIPNDSRGVQVRCIKE